MALRFILRSQAGRLRTSALSGRETTRDRPPPANSGSPSAAPESTAPTRATSRTDGASSRPAERVRRARASGRRAPFARARSPAGRLHGGWSAGTLSGRAGPQRGGGSFSIAARQASIRGLVTPVRSEALERRPGLVAPQLQARARRPVGRGPSPTGVRAGARRHDTPRQANAGRARSSTGPSRVSFPIEPASLARKFHQAGFDWRCMGV